MILETMASQVVVVAIAAVGMTLVIVEGGIDLSVGSTVALVTVVVARALVAGVGPGVAVLVGIATGLACGALNGGLIAGLGVSPFIATLGTMSALRGLAKGLAHEQKIDAPAQGLDELMALAPRGSPWLVSPGVWIAGALALAGAVLLGRTRFGRHVVAVGSNARTARLCGISVGRVTVATYALAGALAGVAGVMEFGKLTVGDPTDAPGLELDVIAAVVIGGGSLSGGQGSVAGSLIGAALMTVLKNGSMHLGVANWVQQILTGVIIVAAAALDRYRQARAGAVS
ncbi:MAG: ABC transporter permease [Myxococcales bacterium]|nr:ABC transporter permease [Myxococcales bacterium]